MTAKRGMLWKTPWRRQKPEVTPRSQQVWWFNNFQDANGRIWFQQPLATPAVGDTSASSFWLGTVLAASAANTSGGVGRRANPPLGGDWVGSIFLNGLTDPTEAIGFSKGPIIDDDINTVVNVTNLGAVPPVLRAVVALTVVIDRGASGRTQEMWVDGNLREVVSDGAPYTADAVNRFTTVAPDTAFLSSYAGGNSVPTHDEIKRWFAATRFALAAAQIPSKTLDQYAAANTPGVVPAALVNLAGGQNAPSASQGVSPPAANTLFDTVFAY